MRANGSVDSRIDAAIERWQSQLLQLNRRNNLLYFKGNPEQARTGSGRRATLHCVPITNFGPDEIDEYLQRENRDGPRQEAALLLQRLQRRVN